MLINKYLDRNQSILCVLFKVSKLFAPTILFISVGVVDNFQTLYITFKNACYFLKGIGRGLIREVKVFRNKMRKMSIQCERKDEKI